MKKKSIKTLSLKKSAISNLKGNIADEIKGGTNNQDNLSSFWFVCQAKCFSVPCL